MAGFDPDVFGSAAPAGGGGGFDPDVFGASTVQAPTPTTKSSGATGSWGAPLTRMEKLSTGAADPIHGGAQLLTNLLPDGVVKAGNNANNWLADKTGLVARLPEGGVDQQVRQREADYQGRRADAGESGFDGWRTTGNVLSPANLAIASRAPAAVSTGGRVLSGALGGAASAALNPITEGTDYLADKTKQIGIGTAFGGAVPAAIGGLSRAVSPKASMNADLQLLKAEGVKPTIGQTLGGWANSLEEKAQSIPLVGDAISYNRNKALEQFNTAALNRATAPVGAKVKGAGQDAVKEAGDVISNVYNQGKNMLGGFSIDRQASTELASLRTMAQTGLEGRERKTVEGYFKDYLQKPALTAEAFKELDSKLATDVARYSRSPDAYQQKVGDALAEVRRIVADNAKRANPQAADVLKRADAAWANLVRVEGASVGAKGREGVFTPGQLLTAVRGADQSVRDRSTARGTALMQDLGTAGQNVLGNKVPDSGTAGRLGWGALGAALYANPALTGAALGGGLLGYAPPVQSLLRGAVSARPQSAEAIAEALRKSSPALVPLGAQMGLGLLN